MSIARKRYYCPVEVTVDVLAGRWTPVVLAHLKEGVHRYGELRRRMPDVSEKVLTERLRLLERSGLVERTCASRGTRSGVLSVDRGGAQPRPGPAGALRLGVGRAARTGVSIEPVADQA